MLQCAIDFEYFQPAEPHMGIISCSLKPEGQPTATYWLLEDLKGQATLITDLQALRATHILVGYTIQLAEARCLAALGLNPNEWQWRDLYLEWRWLRNGDYRYSHGKVMKQIRDGKFAPTLTAPPRARTSKRASQEELDEAEVINQEWLGDIRAELHSNGDDETEVGLQEASWGLLDALYFFDVITPQGYEEAFAVKKAVRDGIIVQGTLETILEAKDAILEYNAADVHQLLELADAMVEHMCLVGEEEHDFPAHGEIIQLTMSPQDISAIQLGMGQWAARLAKYAHRGIPLHPGRLKRLLEIVPVLQRETQENWNREHPETPLYRVGDVGSFMLERRHLPLPRSPYLSVAGDTVSEFTRDSGFIENLIQTFQEDSGLETYPRTRTGLPDMSKKVVARYAAGENLIKQYERHQGTLSALKTYSPNPKGRVEALDFIGTDGKQRPDFGPYGTQTARNAAKAKSLCFLGPHWLRTLVDPEPGMAVVELDFGSQEVWIAAVESGDKNLMAAYQSNDVYVYYAQLVGMYPKDLPIPSEEERNEAWFQPHKKTRSIAKTIVLSIQFGAGYKSVAGAVRDATKDESITEDNGKEWVADYQDAYSDYSYFCKELRKSYRSGVGIVLSSGWRMGKDNPSDLSASNLPVQGGGSVILQRACELCDEAGLTIICTLHDAVSFYCKEQDAEEVARIGTECMQRAAALVLGRDGMKVGHPEIVRHGQIWIHSERAQQAWSKLKSHFQGTY